MEELKKADEKLSTLKVIGGVFLSVAILVIAQISAVSISQILYHFGISNAIYSMIAGVLYIAFTLIGSTLFCRKFLKISIIKMRIFHIQLQTFWVVAAILMPISVIFIYILLGGHWEVNIFHTETVLEKIIGAVAFYGLAAGIVEEIIFRGLIMGCLEKRFHIKIAILIPSILFGLLHIIGNDLDFASVIQLLLAGSIVSILFSLIAYESNSIWNNALVHGFWNMTMIGGVLYIGNHPDNDSIFNFVLNNKSFWLSGGDFGIESSVISIAVYLIFIVFATILIQMKKIHIVHK